MAYLGNHKLTLIRIKQEFVSVSVRDILYEQTTTKERMWQRIAKVTRKDQGQIRDLNVIVLESI
jgi:hypothetical protein